MTIWDLLREDTLASARALLGWRLVHEASEGTTAGIIVETEAYTEDDPASHSFGRRNTRNEAMFGKPGTTYVYRIHQQVCLNIVTRPEGIGEAVLIRALEPEDGLELMRRRRGPVPDKFLCSGPGRLCQAMGITLAHGFMPLWDGPLHLETGTPVPDEEVVQASRVGISRAVHHPWRFYDARSAHISKRARPSPAPLFPRETNGEAQ